MKMAAFSFIQMSNQNDLMGFGWVVSFQIPTIRALQIILVLT